MLNIKELKNFSNAGWIVWFPSSIEVSCTVKLLKLFAKFKFKIHTQFRLSLDCLACQMVGEYYIQCCWNACLFRDLIDPPLQLLFMLWILCIIYAYNSLSILHYCRPTIVISWLLWLNTLRPHSHPTIQLSLSLRLVSSDFLGPPSRTLEYALLL